MKKSGKKLCALALAAAMLGLTACGSSSGTTDDHGSCRRGGSYRRNDSSGSCCGRGESVFTGKQIL